MTTAWHRSNLVPGDEADITGKANYVHDLLDVVVNLKAGDLVSLF